MLLFSCSVVSNSLRPCGLQHARLTSPSPSPSLLKFISIELVIPSNHILYHPLLLLSVIPSIWVFSSELALCIRWPKYQSFSFSINSSSEYSGFISFRIDWFDHLAVQGTLKSLLQHQFESISSSALILFYCPTLTSVHGYWKTIPLTIRIFVGKLMSLLFNTLSRFAIAFLPRSKHFLISRLQSPSTVIFGAQSFFWSLSFFWIFGVLSFFSTLIFTRHHPSLPSRI